jgi:hypothetical protein
LVAPQNRRREDGAGHAARSGGLLHLACHARVFQSGLKTGRGVTMGGARGIIVEIVSRGSSRWMDRCDGLRQTLLPQNAVCSVLGHKGIVVFSVLLGPINRTL